MLGIVALGSLSLSTIPREATPEVNVPYASVLTIYPGSSPLEIENLITDPIESAIMSLDDLKKVDSFSSEGISSIFVEFETGVDIDESVRELQDVVSSAEGILPDDANSTVSRLSFSNMPILTLSISADVDYKDLVEMAKLAQTEILEMSNVSEVELLGVRPEEIAVELDPSSLWENNISITEVLYAIQGSEATMPLGSIETKDTQYTLRFDASLDVQDIDDIVIRQFGDEIIKLGDLGTVKKQLTDSTQYSRISLEGSVPEDAISLNIYKSPGGDIIALVDEIHERLEALQEDELKNATFFVSLDSAQDIRDQLGDLSMSGLATILLVGFILLLALGFREALVAGLAIPLTFFITFTGLSIMGGTLNFLSLFSLILALGILVDTGIVITEGMHIRMRDELDPKKAALATVMEYKWPLISGTLTTVAAFIPMLLMSGIIGEFIKHIPVTVSLTLLASLFVGLGLLPVVGAKVLKYTGEKPKSIFERMIESVKGVYSSVLNWLLTKKWRQRMLLFVMTISFLASLALPITGILNVTMFPQTDYRYFFIEIEMPNGSLLKDTNKVVENIEAILIENEDIESIVVTVGKSGNIADGLGALGVPSPNLANFVITLSEDRERSSLDIIDEYREEFEGANIADINVIGMSDGPPSASPIEFDISGPDLDLLAEYGQEAQQVLSEVEGAVNVDFSLSESVNEYILEIDRDAASEKGVSAISLAQIARLSTVGMSVLTLNNDGEEINVNLRLDSKGSLQDVLDLPITTAYGTYPLSEFISISKEPAPTTILHSDGERSVNISSDLETDFNAALVLAEFQKEFDLEMEDGYVINYGGESEEMVESFRSLGRSMLLGIMLIVIILILQFNSFKQAIIILMTIPLALIGVFTGLSVLGLPLSFPAFVGVVALSGIVVNNAIILIDRINKNCKSGMEKEEAILRAGASRFQPILLTSITTIIGILPLALSDPTWGPLGFTIISGLIFSTVLTLIVIPAAYETFIKV